MSSIGEEIAFASAKKSRSLDGLDDWMSGTNSESNGISGSSCSTKGRLSLNGSGFNCLNIPSLSVVGLKSLYLDISLTWVRNQDQSHNTRESRFLPNPRNS